MRLSLGSVVLILIILPASSFNCFSTRPLSLRLSRCNNGAFSRSCKVRRRLSSVDSEGPTASKETEVKNPPVPSLPTYKDLALFAGPALALWITGPLLSLIDTSAVGLTAGASGAVGLAALGPATTFVDGAQYLFAFISVATTNLLATAIAKGDDEEMKLVIRSGIRCALRCGVGVMAVMLIFAPQLLGIYVGGHLASSVVVPAARYVRIRSLCMPTLLVANALQAALLGAKDSVTPLLALSAAALINAFGDVFLVCALKWGLSGAAIATVLSQWGGLVLLVRASTTTLGLGRWKGFKKETVTPELQAARMKMRSRFYAFCPPVIGMVIGKMSAFGFMTHVASCMPAAQLAAHQVVLSLFFLLAPFSEISSQTFQAFLPQFCEKKTKDDDNGTQSDRAEKMQSLASKLTNRLQGSSLGVGILVAAVGALVPLFGAGLFTKDVLVAQAMRPLAASLFISASLHSLVCSAEGVLLVRSELGFLSKLYAASAVLMPAALIMLKRRGAGLPAVWWSFVVFQAVRALILNLKVRKGVTT